MWTGMVRVVSSSNRESDRLDTGGVIITEIQLQLHIDAQDCETFIGRSRPSTAPANESGSHVWGSICSTGDEALFITETGGRGHVWFERPDEIEYCLTNLNEQALKFYCARLCKS